jgi:starch synthase (maltosyl-transferring)
MAEQQIDGRRRVVIEAFPRKSTAAGSPSSALLERHVLVEAEVFADGHDQVACQIMYWQDMKELQTSLMKPLGKDRWRDEFSVELLSRYQYTVEGWIDRFQTWRGARLKRVAAGQDVYFDLLIGAVLIEEAAGRARGDDALLLRDWAGRLREAKDRPEGAHIALEEEPLGVLQRYPATSPAADHSRS